MILADLLSFVWTHPLNADNSRAALGRVAQWQIASRLMPGPIALPFVDDTYLLATRGLAGATGNWYCGLYEGRDMAFVLHVLRPDDVFLDVGANIGSYTVLAAATGAAVTSVEPIPATFERLERIIAFNRLGDRVRPLCCGLSETPGTARFTTDRDAMNRVVPASAAGVDLPVRTLDDVADGRTPALMKIDVEGHEISVLRGAARTLADPRLLAAVIESAESGPDEEVARVMRANGFEETGYDPFGRTLVPPTRPIRNAIFVRDRAAVERRVAGARRYRLVNGTI